MYFCYLSEVYNTPRLRGVLYVVLNLYKII
nr:MAG TPA: hypothetical protein [Caudoviricetes sp.]